MVSYVVSALVGRLFLPRSMGHERGSPNRWLGAFLGFSKGLIILAVVLALLQASLPNSKEILNNAQFYKAFHFTNNILAEV